MSNTTTDRPGCDVICRNHSAKSGRDLYRVCPSKISKHELENLYFALVENNLDLKKTVHSQQDKLKILSTKLQRMTVVQRNAAGKEKDCCNSKVLLREQKEKIAELQKANERMTDRIRLLNMRLCSAKQFLKRSPLQISRCPRSVNAPVSFKNSSMSALNAKPSETSIKMTTVSCQYLSEETPESPKLTQVAETETDVPEKDDSEKPCNENKCRTLMDELKQKIVNLQEELSKAHREYSNRISKLENDVSDLHEENIRVRSSYVASSTAVQRGEKTAEELRGKLREAEGKINDITMQLAIERRKVAELETALKLTSTSGQVFQIIEKLNILKQQKHTAADVSQTCSVCSYCSLKRVTDNATSTVELMPSTPAATAVDRLSKSDDSGCTDLNKSSETEEEMVMEKINQEMLKRITDLQTQLDALRIKAAGESVKADKQSSSDFENCEDERQMAVITMTEERPNVILEIQRLNALDVQKSNSPVRDINEKGKIQTSTPNKEDPAEKAGCSKQSWAGVIETDDNVEESIKSQNIVPLKRTGVGKINLQTPDKPASDNKYQIPGPIGASSYNNDKKKAFRNRKSISKESKDKDKSEERSVKIADNKDLYTNNTHEAFDNKTAGKEVKTNDPISSVNVEPSNLYENEAKNVDFKLNASESSNPNRKISSDGSNDCQSKFVDSIQVDSSEVGFVNLTKDNLEIDKQKGGSKDLLAKPKESNMNYIHASEIAVGPVADPQKTATEKANETLYNVKIDEYELCASRVTVCRCPKSSRGPISVFRTCSGTSRTHCTTADTDKFRICACLDNGNLEQPLMGTQGEIEPGSKQQHSDCVPQNAASSRRDSSPNATDPLALQNSLDNSKSSLTRDSATYNAAEPSGLRDSATAVAARRDSATYTTAAARLKDSTASTAVVARRDSANYETAPSGFRDSAVSTSAEAVRRDSATYNTVAPSGYRDSGVSTYARRDSATYSGVAPSAFRNSAVNTAVGSRRDSATYTAAVRDSATQKAAVIFAKAALARRGSATYSAEGPPLVHDAATTTKPEAHRHDCSRRSRSTSPDNTEREISSLSDLPPEKDGKCPSPACRSPGEAGTDTRGYSGTLSDGELPAGRDPTHRKLSFGERNSYADPAPGSPNSQMEATLNAISAELARCRQLLASSRSHERARALHAALGARRLGGGGARTAAFTLHVGTLVLSDEAVVDSRDKALYLTWKFYDQSVAMARMRTGRVVIFDFSTEYDVTFSEEFLNYMRHGEMPLSICEMNKQDEPFATCSLPLRDALLHTNRRADMSLALVAGAGMSARGRDALAAGDELGVLDLWCMLRTTAVRNSSLGPGKEEYYIERPSQTAEDERTERMSQEFAIRPQPARVSRQSRTWEPPITLGSRDWTGDLGTTAKRDEDELSLELPEASKDSRRRSPPDQKYFSGPLYSNRPQVGFEESWEGVHTRRKSSGIIASEVPVKIKSSDEMKRALDRKERPLFMTPAMDDDMGVPDSLQDMLKRERKMSIAGAVAKQSSPRRSRIPFAKTSTEEDDINPAIVKKYSNIGTNKGPEMSRKTVKYTDDADAPTYEEPGKLGSSEENLQSIEITILWLALNEECEAMTDPEVHRLYVAYSFLGRRGADLETPVSLPKPKHYGDKCYFNFKKTFHLHESELPLLARMARCRAGRTADPRDCIVFTVVGEPRDDPLGLACCRDIGHAYLYLGDVLVGAAGAASHVHAAAVRGARGACGALGVRLAGLHVLRYAAAHGRRTSTVPPN